MIISIQWSHKRSTTKGETRPKLGARYGYANLTSNKWSLIFSKFIKSQWLPKAFKKLFVSYHSKGPSSHVSCPDRLVSDTWGKSSAHEQLISPQVFSIFHAEICLFIFQGSEPWILILFYRDHCIHLMNLRTIQHFLLYKSTFVCPHTSL